MLLTSTEHHATYTLSMLLTLYPCYLHFIHVTYTILLTLYPCYLHNITYTLSMLLTQYYLHLLNVIGVISDTTSGISSFMLPDKAANVLLPSSP